MELTGFALLSEGGAEGDRSVLAEVLLGGVGALIVLALVFGSLSGVPLVVAAVSILGTFLALLGLDLPDRRRLRGAVPRRPDRPRCRHRLLPAGGHPVARGAGRRARQRRRGAPAMATAGRSVVFSGFTVAVSLAALVLVPLPFLRSIGFGGLLIPLLSVATAVTLVPALLSAAGPRLTWPRRGAQVRPSRAWAGIARTVVHHRWLTIAGTSAVLLALAYPVLGLTLGSPQLSGITSDSAGSQAITRAVDSGVPAGVLRPVEVSPTAARPRSWCPSRAWRPCRPPPTRRGATQAHSYCRCISPTTPRAPRAKPPWRGCGTRSASPWSAAARPRTRTS